MRLTFISNIGFILLAIYLILIGIATIFPIVLPNLLLGIMALLAGIFILVGK